MTRLNYHCSIFILIFLSFVYFTASQDYFTHFELSQSLGGVAYTVHHSIKVVDIKLYLDFTIVLRHIITLGHFGLVFYQN